MSRTTRRHFIKISAVAGGAFALGARSTTLFARKFVKPLRILILGGTGFTGPFQVRYALSRGHNVTVFNRGKTHPGELPEGVEQLISDRNGQLDALKDRQRDVAIGRNDRFCPSEFARGRAPRPAALSDCQISRALAKGLTLRRLTDTARDTLTWFKSQLQDRQPRNDRGSRILSESRVRAGLAHEREAEVLTAWHKQQR